MRYNDDVINAESWNPDFKKSLLPPTPESKKNVVRKKKPVRIRTGASEKPRFTPVTDDRAAAENLQVSNPDLTGITKIYTATINIRDSKKRTKRRKKRGIFRSTGLLTGMLSRYRDRK